MDVSIIIVNYNTRNLTLQCLSSIYKLTKDILFEVIVVDNASSDNSVSSIKCYFPQVILVENNKNVGFGQANNIGLQYSKGKYIFLLNSDTYLLNNAVKEFYDIAEKDSPKVACYGTLLVNNRGDIVHSCGKYIRLHRLFFPFFYRKNRNEQIYIGDVEVIIGADLFIRRDIIENIGFFDSVFFMYHEEDDLQRRIGNAGYRKRLIESPQIVHLEGESFSTKHTFHIESTFIYIKKWYPLFFYYIYRIYYLLTHFIIFFNLKNIEKEYKNKLLKVCFYKVKI